VDAIDEYSMQQIKEYDGHKFVSATEEGLTLPGDAEDDTKDLQEQYKPTCARVKEILGDRVESVIVSQRMENSPCCLVSGKYGYSANMQRILKAQALRDAQSMMMVPSKKIMELNPQHLLVRQIHAAAPKQDKVSKQVVGDLSWMLFETALLTSGFSLDSPANFADRIHRLVAHGMGFSTADTPTPPSAAEAGAEAAAAAQEATGAPDPADVKDITQEAIDALAAASKGTGPAPGADSGSVPVGGDDDMEEVD